MIKVAANLANMCAARYKFAAQQAAGMPAPANMETKDPGNNKGIQPRVNSAAPVAANTAPPFLRRWSPEQSSRLQNTQNFMNSYVRKPTQLDKKIDNWHAPLKDPYDWKVDEVGIGNDFKITAPSNTLSIRG